MKILITGGCGFIGHNVVSRLEKLGHQCEIIDNMTNYGVIAQDEILKLHKERKKYYSAVVHTSNIQDDCVNEIMKNFKPDTIIHMASFPRQKFININPHLSANVMIGGLVNLLESAKIHFVKRFVYISSSMVYGNFIKPVDEDSPTNPVGQYGILKLAGELLVRDYSNRTGIQHIIIRPSAVYGPRDIKDRVINKFFLAAMGGNPLEVEGINEMLDMTYVDDAVNGIVEATLNSKHFNRTYNITRSVGRTLLEASELIIQIVGRGEIKTSNKDLEYPSRGRLKIDRAIQELGYTPKIDIEEGFQKCYEWLKNTIR